MCEEFQNRRNISWTKQERSVFIYDTDKNKRLVSQTAQFEIS